MKKKLPVICCAFVTIMLSLYSQISFATGMHVGSFQQKDTLGHAPAIDAAGKILELHMKRLDIPGMQVAISSKGKVLWSGALGYADVENKQPVTSETSFRIGSVSKAITGAALGTLLQQDKIKLEESVAKYVTLFPPKQWPVTIAQLAGHTSGIRHYKSKDESSSTKNYSTVSEALQIFSNDSLAFKPGSDVLYSSFGYVLLSAAIESAAKQSFLKFIEQNLFLPLGMTHSSMDYPDNRIGFKSKFYVINDSDKRVEAPFVNNSNKWGAGGMLSSAEDLVKFGNALLGNSFLGDKVKEKIFTSSTTTDGRTTGYGIGWKIMRDAYNREVYLMDGSLPSGRSVLLIYPKEKLVLAVLANTGTSILFNEQEALMLADLFLRPEGLNPTANEKKSVIGKYKYTTLFDEENIAGDIHIFEEGGKLRGEMTLPNRFFKNRIIPIPIVKVKEQRFQFIGLPGNWMVMDVRCEGKSINGNWRFGPISGTLSGRKE